MNEPAALCSLQLACYRQWLDSAHAVATSTTVKELIREVTDELHVLAAYGNAALTDLREALVGAFESIISAMEIETAAAG